MGDTYIGLDDVRDLRLVCAWCTREIAPGIEPTSHGICRACGDTLVTAHRQGRTFEPVLQKEGVA